MNIVNELALVVAATSQIIVGSTLLYAGGFKLRDLTGAKIAILDYRVVPARLATPAAIAIGVTEFVTGIGIVLGLPFAASVGVLLLALLTATAGSALARGLVIDCHCGGVGERVSMRTMQRNALFIIALVVAVALTEGRPGGSAWVLGPELGNAVATAAGVLLVIAVFTTTRLLTPVTTT